MDPLGIAASIIAVIQVAGKVISLCKIFIEAVRDAPAALRTILVETSTLKTILDTVQFIATCEQQHGPSRLESLVADDGPVEGCRKVLVRMVELFPSGYELSSTVPGRTGSKSRRIAKAATTALAWPLRESRAKELLAELSQFKSTITLALTADSSRDIKDIKEKANAIHADLTDMQKREVFKWLHHTDPSPFHHRACEQQEDGTCDWMLRSEEWDMWLAGKKRSIWINGVPGRWQNDSRIPTPAVNNLACVYYYCYYGCEQDEVIPFLKWVTSQLCRLADTIPAGLHKSFQCGTEPSLADLLGSLEAIAESFHRIYIVLDAIDESIPRADLLRVLRDLITDPRFSNISLLATSRVFVDIENTMSSIAAPISMNNPLLDADIRLFVESQLSTHTRLNLWPDGLKGEVCEALSNKAKGMFRWVVCQIDVLQHLRPDRDNVRRALETLPKTLDETYERIFNNIPEHARIFVHHSLKWIYAHFRLFEDTIPCPILLQAVQRSTSSSASSVLVTTYEYDFDDGLLREFCGCLISATTHDYGDYTVAFIQISHRTVWEFISSSRIQNTTASVSYFATNESIAKSQYLELILREALIPYSGRLMGHAPEKEEWTRALMNDFHIYSIASAFDFLSHKEEIFYPEDAPAPLLFDLLDWRRPHFDMFGWALRSLFSYGLIHVEEQLGFWEIIWQELPNEPEVVNDARILVNLLTIASDSALVIELMKIPRMKDALRCRIELEFLIQIGDDMPWKFQGTTAEFLFLWPSAWEANCAEALLGLVPELHLDPTSLMLSYLSSPYHRLDHAEFDLSILARLLELGADPTGRGYAICPLQMAVAKKQYSLTKPLLQAGADPNSVGDRRGESIEWEEGTMLGCFNYTRDCSPLYILENLEWFGLTEEDEFPIYLEVEEVRQLKELLLQYMGREVLGFMKMGWRLRNSWIRSQGQA